MNNYFSQEPISYTSYINLQIKDFFIKKNTGVVFGQNIISGSRISGLGNGLDKLDNIKSINVLKGEQAIKKYPEDGKNGVAEITSRKGETKPSSLINPTFYLDGVKITEKEMKAISPNDIESIKD